MYVKLYYDRSMSKIQTEDKTLKDKQNTQEVEKENQGKSSIFRSDEEIAAMLEELRKKRGNYAKILLNRKKPNSLGRYIASNGKLRLSEKQKELLIKRYKGQVTPIVVPTFMLTGLNKARKDTLAVITYAKKLCSYIFQVTQKSPMKFRYTFIGRLQNFALDILEHLYRASQYRADSPEPARLRRQHQRDAYTILRMISYFAMLALENKCILKKHYISIVDQTNETMTLLVAWMHEK